ncbi:hypothetical protein K439DRAFT_1411660 [Ramaria rubella]|nr:hypothetical protein K439DRAFT_1411660 [Ramaria rubella]
MSAQDYGDQIEYHPDFSPPDGDITIISREGLRFRIHRLFLIHGSRVFKDMVSFPPTPDYDPSNSVVRNIDEDSETIAHLLKMISGKEYPVLDEFEAIERLIFAADKLDMPGPLSVMKALLGNPAFTRDPVRLYVLACRMRWYDVAKATSKLTLQVNIATQSALSQFRKLGCTDDLVNLLELHQNHRDAVELFMDTRAHLPWGPNKCLQMYEAGEWVRFKDRVIREISRAPGGTFILGGQVDGWPETSAAMGFHCSRCDAPHRKLSSILDALKKLLRELPETIP